MKKKLFINPGTVQVQFTANGGELHLRFESRTAIPAGSSGHGRLLCSAKWPICRQKSHLTTLFRFPEPPLKRDEAFSELTAMIDSIIRTQKFEGAAADLFNANIISRDLGLVDRQARDVDIGTKDPLATFIDALATQPFSLK